jgi:hypothetical protein
VSDLTGARQKLLRRRKSQGMRRQVRKKINNWKRVNDACVIGVLKDVTKFLYYYFIAPFYSG